MNKKARRAAICSALSLLFRENKLTVLDSLDLEQISTKGFVSVLNTFELKKTLVIAESGRNLELSARNVRDVKLLKPESINIFDLMKFQNLMLTQDAIRKMEGALQS
jgi:large subunit ribosomal protein L4